MTQTADQTLNCCDCSNTFLFTARDQEFFSQQGYSPPRRCKTCRDQKKARQNESGLARGNQPLNSRPAFQRPQVAARPAPVVQYRAPVQPLSEARQEEPKKVTVERSFGPDAAPRSASKGDFRGKKDERRRDAYSERRQRRNNFQDWDSDEE